MSPERIPAVPSIDLSTVQAAATKHGFKTAQLHAGFQTGSVQLTLLGHQDENLIEDANKVSQLLELANPKVRVLANLAGGFVAVVDALAEIKTREPAAPKAKG
jgi:hypothetical protein